MITIEHGTWERRNAEQAHNFEDLDGHGSSRRVATSVGELEAYIPYI
jgi:hypothetical protein